MILSESSERRSNSKKVRKTTQRTSTKLSQKMEIISFSKNSKMVSSRINKLRKQLLISKRLTSPLSSQNKKPKKKSLKRKLKSKQIYLKS